MPFDESKHPRDTKGRFTSTFAKPVEGNAKEESKITHFSAFAKGEKVKPKVKELSKTVELSPDNELSRLIASSDESKYRIIKNYIKEHFSGKELSFPDGIKAVVDNKDAEELTHKADTRKTAELSVLEELIDYAVFENEVPVEHNKFSKMRYYTVRTRLKEKDRDIWLNIGLEKNGNKYHFYDIVPKQ